jgi:hypothetical protein
LYLDAESEEILNIQRNLDVNKEEQLRKMNLLPGKTFYSQRSKSISIEHVPPSQKKIETQKARLPFAMATYQQNKSQQNQQIRLLKNLNSVEINGSFLSMNMGRTGGIVFNSKPNLASQHHEEIYALINNGNKSASNKEMVTLSRLERFTDASLNAKLLVNANLIANTEKLAANLSQQGKSSSKKSEKNSSKSNKRPKTSKL